MTALTGTEKSRISRERAKLGLVQLIAWVPADKLQECQDAIDHITAPVSISDEMMQKVAARVLEVSLYQKLSASIDQITKGETND